MLRPAESLIIVVLKILDLTTKLQKLPPEATLNEFLEGFIHGFTLGGQARQRFRLLK